MQKASDYQRYADECHSLAANLDESDRKRMVRIAQDWASLARQRSRLVRANPWLAEPGEIEEDALLLCAGGMHCGAVPRPRDRLPSQVCLGRCIV